MKKEIKEKWVKALRSGKYKQATCSLHVKGGGYCCLGVLTDLYLKDKGISDGWSKDVDGKSCLVKLSKKGWYQLESYLPKKVYDWAGIEGVNRPDPVVDGNSLSVLNDGNSETKKRTFKQIATLIEKHL